MQKNSFSSAFVLMAVLFTVCLITSNLFASKVFAIGKILPSLAALVYILDLVIFVFAIIGIVNVVKGRAKALPLIGKFTIIK